METKQPTTLLEAISYFSDPDRAIQFAAQIRWPEGPTCPHCESKRHGFISTRQIWKCKDCKKQYSVKRGPIVEDSPLGFDKWLPAIWLVVNCKNGISSHELARDLGVHQQTAWYMLHRIRLAMQTGSFEKARGDVEVDETFIGGLARNMHRARRKARIHGTGGTDKAAVMGILQRGGEVRTVVLRDARKRTLQGHVRDNVAAGSAIFSDASKGYVGLRGDFEHEVVDHAVEYVRGRVHTNGLENYWSLLKRGLHGTYISVEPFHLFRYLDEQSYRYNTRKISDAERFRKVLGRAEGRRVTYKELIGQAS